MHQYLTLAHSATAAGVESVERCTRLLHSIVDGPLAALMACCTTFNSAMGAVVDEARA